MQLVARAVEVVAGAGDRVAAEAVVGEVAVGPVALGVDEGEAPVDPEVGDRRARRRVEHQPLVAVVGVVAPAATVSPIGSPALAQETSAPIPAGVAPSSDHDLLSYDVPPTVHALTT